MRRTFPDEIPGCTRADILDGTRLETDKAVSPRCGRPDGRVDQTARTFPSEVFGEPLTLGISDIRNRIQRRMLRFVRDIIENPDKIRQQLDVAGAVFE